MVQAGDTAVEQAAQREAAQQFARRIAGKRFDIDFAGAQVGLPRHLRQRKAPAAAGRAEQQQHTGARAVLRLQRIVQKGRTRVDLALVPEDRRVPAGQHARLAVQIVDARVPHAGQLIEQLPGHGERPRQRRARRVLLPIGQQQRIDRTLPVEHAVNLVLSNRSKQRKQVGCKAERRARRLWVALQCGECLFKAAVEVGAEREQQAEGLEIT